MRLHQVSSMWRGVQYSSCCLCLAGRCRDPVRTQVRSQSPGRIPKMEPPILDSNTPMYSYGVDNKEDPQNGSSQGSGN